MFFQHSTLGLLDPIHNKGVILFLYEIVPFCPALFLFLSGFSLTFKFEKGNSLTFDNKDLLHLVKRGVILILSSQILFFFENGIQLPDIFIASGILSTIGIMIIISGIVLKFKYKKLIFTILIVILSFFTILTLFLRIYLVPFNYGYEPMSPTIIYGFVGVLVGLFLLSKDKPKTKNIFVSTLTAIGLMIMVIYTIKYGFGKVFFTEIGRYEIVRYFDRATLPQNLFFHTNDSGLYTAKIWNFDINSMVASLGLVLLLFGIGYFSEPLLQKLKIKALFLPGRYAFVNYFFHLIIIALFVVIFDYGIFNTLQFVIFLSMLFGFSYLISFVTDKFSKKKRKQLPA